MLPQNELVLNEPMVVVHLREEVTTHRCRSRFFRELTQYKIRKSGRLQAHVLYIMHYTKVNASFRSFFFASRYCKALAGENWTLLPM